MYVPAWVQPEEQNQQETCILRGLLQGIGFHECGYGPDKSKITEAPIRRADQNSQAQAGAALLRQNFFFIKKAQLCFSGLQLIEFSPPRFSGLIPLTDSRLIMDSSDIYEIQHHLGYRWIEVSESVCSVFDFLKTVPCESILARIASYLFLDGMKYFHKMTFQFLKCNLIERR